MRSSYVVSAFIALLIVLWVGSGQIASLGRESVDPPSLADVRAQAAARTADAAARTRVRARIIQARDYTRRVNVTGRTEVNRSVDVRAERTGRIVELPVAEGDRVSGRGPAVPPGRKRTHRPAWRKRGSGCGRRRSSIRRLQAAEGSGLPVGDRAGDVPGLSWPAARASAESRRNWPWSARSVRAPFRRGAGAARRRPGRLPAGGRRLRHRGRSGSDAGHGLRAGAAHRQASPPGQAGGARLLTGETVSGTVRYVASVANAGTRTYRVELEVPNGELRPARRRHGGAVVARRGDSGPRRVSSALLTLADDGTVGVRIVDADDRVRFVPVEVVDDADGGVWISGSAGLRARIITVGQELVVDGDRVDRGSRDRRRPGGRERERRSSAPPASDRTVRRPPNRLPGESHGNRRRGRRHAVKRI
jgi:multidrug efflux system membrane fusion protein